MGDALNTLTGGKTDAGQGNGGNTPTGPIISSNQELYTPAGYRRVYMGNTGSYQGSTFVSQSTIVSDAEAMVAIYNWSDAEKRALGEKLYNAGLIKNPGDWNSILGAWQDAVRGAADAYAAGQRNVSPWALINMQADMNQAAMQAQQRRPTVDVSTSTSMPSEASVKAAIQSLFTQKVGRAPTPKEMAKYVAMAMNAAKANPQKTTTRTVTDVNGNRTSNSTSSGGLDGAGLGQILGDAIQGTSEAGTYQAATYYMNALQAVLGAAV